jgi:hypothetical protein
MYFIFKKKKKGDVAQSGELKVQDEDALSVQPLVSFMAGECARGRDGMERQDAKQEFRGQDLEFHSR